MCYKLTQKHFKGHKTLKQLVLKSKSTYQTNKKNEMFRPFYRWNQTYLVCWKGRMGFSGHGNNKNYYVIAQCRGFEHVINYVLRKNLTGQYAKSAREVPEVVCVHWVKRNVYLIGHHFLFFGGFPLFIFWKKEEFLFFKLAFSRAFVAK